MKSRECDLRRMSEGKGCYGTLLPSYWTAAIRAVMAILLAHCSPALRLWLAFFNVIILHKLDS